MIINFLFVLLNRPRKENLVSFLSFLQFHVTLNFLEYDIQCNIIHYILKLCFNFDLYFARNIKCKRISHSRKWIFESPERSLAVDVQYYYVCICFTVLGESLTLAVV